MSKRKKQSKGMSFDILSMYGIAGIAVALGIVILLFTFVPFGRDTGGARGIISLPEKMSEASCDHQRILDGVCVENAEDINPKLIAVMIENHFESWPPSSLANARVVYEAPVEGNISRFLVLYTEDQEIDKAGPIRSVRPYYLDWLAEYGTPLYIHVGGSNAALERIKTDGVNDLSEMFRGWYFWRDNNRFAPHNAYSSSDLWLDALAVYSESYADDRYDGWLFDEVDACEENCVTSIEVVFSGLTYTAGWEYNSSTESYFRTQAGDPHFDSDSMQIVADTVIVQYVDTTVLDGVGRLGMETIGTGQSMVFQKGFAVPGEWRKESVAGRTRFFAESGDEVVLNSGKIWIEVINRDAVEFE